MYHKPMTIKRRLFRSNIRMILIIFITLAFIARIIGFIAFGTMQPGQQTMAQLRESLSRDTRIPFWFLFFTLFMIAISIINSFFTHRMTRRIVKPLVPLSEGVRQIQDSNFAYRIDYQNDDEFRPICEAFNKMAAKLETSTAEQKKNEASRRELIAGISHDLRTPLTSIKGYIEGIETGVASTPEMRKQYLSIIKNKTADLERIIDQLFLFSKLEMDEFPLAMRSVDISLAVSDMIEDSLSEYASRGLDIQSAGMPKGIAVSADVLMLRNVVINILENSVKYKIKEHAQMEISAALDNSSVLLRFADDGPGVDADVLPKLFDAFYRSDPSRNKKGSGLGLAITAKIIECMGGSIHAELPAAGGLAIVIKMPVLISGAV